MGRGLDGRRYAGRQLNEVAAKSLLYKTAKGNRKGPVAGALGFALFLSMFGI